MSRPRIEQIDGQIGFFWQSHDGTAIHLPALVLRDDESEQLVPTHLEALDDALIDAAGRWSEILGCPSRIWSSVGSLTSGPISGKVRKMRAAQVQ